ncbi:homeobox-leucine zipper protein HAT22-like [Magnolia sinica]|uniref:homeobox-leucine zipper protein HAT22-like n=1 Tax=Magnolia sinica TaxID=86752 RepID=UPI00265A3C21|nr:homeobox-leucine zipper protein HAT22-like [Magnolia sinica]
MGHEDLCDTGLVLGLGSVAKVEGGLSPNRNHRHPLDKSDRLFSMILEPSLTLSLPDDTYTYKESKKIDENNAFEDPLEAIRQSSPHGAVSLFSNTCIKRERDGGGDDIELERISPRLNDEDEEACVRKKLRLTKEQSALLEDNFKEHSTLNPKQKQALAKQLNLRPRQVEVWFQNRRARTKLKQTEVDCEFLKRCCEALTDENRRLQRELHELKAMNFVSPLYMRLPAATLTMCPSCERIGGGAGNGRGGNYSAKNSFAMPPKSHHLYNPFTHSSAAC